MQKIRESGGKMSDGWLDEVVSKDRLDRWRISEAKKLVSLGRAAYYRHAYD